MCIEIMFCRFNQLRQESNLHLIVFPKLATLFVHKFNHSINHSRILSFPSHPIIIPIIVALINEASVPASKACIPSFESKTRLFGASAPIPPI